MATKQVLTRAAVQDAIDAYNEATNKINTSLAEALTQSDLNPDYISYTVGTKPSTTGASEGEIGAYYTDRGWLQKLKLESGIWVDIGEPLIAYTDGGIKLPSDSTINLGGDGRVRFIKNGKTDAGLGDIFFFGDFNAWSTAHGGAPIGEVNNFHAWWGTNDPVRVEFEADQGEMQFYIEGGVGKDAWYGVQEGSTHHWSHGADVSDSATYKFCAGFGLDSDVKFLIRKNGTVSTGQGTEDIPAYGFIGDVDTGIYNSFENNLSIATGGLETIRFTSGQQAAFQPKETVGAPEITFIGDLDTGIRRNAENEVAFDAGGNNVGKYTSDYWHFKVPDAAPPSAMANNRVIMYLDESSNELKFKTKYSNDAEKTGTIALV